MGDLFLGVHIASGIAYLGVATSADGLIMSDPADRIRPSPQLADANQLGDFRDRVSQEIRRLQPAEVGVFRTTRFRNWSFTDAWTRFSLETAVMLAAVGEGVPSRHVVAEDASGTVPCPPNKIPDIAAEAWGVQRPQYWRERAPALAAALALARGEAR
jgi:hypothetical protein